MENDVRSGIEFVKLPPDVGHPISMCVFKDRLYVAFPLGVYRLIEGKTWEQIIAVHPTEGIAYDARAHEVCYL